MQDSDSKRANAKRAHIARPSRRRLKEAATLISILVVAGSIMPKQTSALSIGDLFSAIKNRIEQKLGQNGGDLQTLTLPQPATNINPAPAIGGGDITIVDDSALVAEEGPAGTIADIEKPKNSTISLYVVRPGDSIASIAKMFGVSTNTVLWANDMKRGETLHVGDTLTILPVTGIKYTVKKGDTLASIAKAYKADATDIANFNIIDSAALVVGDQIIIPDGELAGPSYSTRGVGSEPAHNVGPAGTPMQIGYYLAPLAAYRETQKIHGYNAVDLAAPSGTPILASASGDVIVARNNGAWNGGYGNYVVISHDNGSQTLYAHASKIIVGVGESVVQGQVIGYVGSTGKSTGSHLHFEIRNGIRNPF